MAGTLRSGRPGRMLSTYCFCPYIPDNLFLLPDVCFFSCCFCLAQDGVYPEKVNAGRSGDNTNNRRIGQNPEPVSVKFSGKIPSEF